MRWILIAALAATFLFGCASTTHAVAESPKITDQSQVTNERPRMWANKEEYLAWEDWMMSVRFEYYFVVARTHEGTRLWVRLADLGGGTPDDYLRWEELTGRQNAVATVFAMPPQVNTNYKEFKVPHAVDQPIIITAERKNGCKYETGAMMECCDFVEKDVGPGIAYHVSFVTHYKELGPECKL